MHLLIRLQRAGLRKGFSKGSTPWLVLGMSAWGVRYIHKMGQRRSEVLIREELQPGDRIIIANDRGTYD